MPIGQHWFRKSDMYFKVYVPKCPVRYLMRQLHLNSRFCCIYVKTISGCVLWSLRMYSFGTFQPTGYLPCFLDFHMHVIQGPLNTRSNRTLYQLTFKWPTVNYDFLWNYPVFTLNESMLPFSEISRSVLSLFLFQWRFLVCLAPWIQKLWNHLSTTTFPWCRCHYGCTEKAFQFMQLLRFCPRIFPIP